VATDPDFRECIACSCFAVRRAARVITQHFERHLKPSGLRASQFTVLSVLAIGGPQPLSRLADLLAVERTTLTRNLRALLSRGLVTRAGLVAARAALPRWREAQKSIARRLGAGAIGALAAVTEAAVGSSPGRK